MILEVAQDASPLVRLAAGTILYLHIGGGMVALVSGATAAIARKGSRVHRLAGDAFVVSMLIMAAIGAAVSPFLNPPQWVNVIAGSFTLYLVVSGYLAGSRGSDTILIRWISFLVAVAIGVGALALAMSVGDSGSAGPAYAFAGVIALAAIGDLRLVLGRELAAAQRLVRHLWRMSYAWVLATASLFIGQPQIFPESLRGVLFVPVLAVLLFMLFWLIRMLLIKRPLRAV